VSYRPNGLSENTKYLLSGKFKVDNDDKVEVTSYRKNAKEK
jgi:hypothetical protein